MLKCKVIGFDSVQTNATTKTGETVTKLVPATVCVVIDGEAFNLKIESEFVPSLVEHKGKVLNMEVEAFSEAVVVPVYSKDGVERTRTCEGKVTKIFVPTVKGTCESLAAKLTSHKETVVDKAKSLATKTKELATKVSTKVKSLIDRFDDPFDNPFYKSSETE